jgi:hypothetical protein
MVVGTNHDQVPGIQHCVMHRWKICDVLVAMALLECVRMGRDL